MDIMDFEDQPDPIPDWGGWSDEDKKVINDHIKYTASRLELLNSALKYGPLDKNRSVKKPGSVVDKLIYKDNTHKDNNDDKFIEYLCMKKITNYSTGNSDLIANVNSSPKTLEEMQTNIKEICKFLSEQDTMTLKRHIDAGKLFLNYQKLFKVLKRNRRSGTRGTWNKWLSDVVEISKSYIYRHIQVYKLCKEYPGLCHLSVSFTELFRMKDRISTIFTVNPNLAQEWGK